MKAIVIFILSLLSLSLQAQDTLQMRVYFACNSAEVSAAEERNLLALAGHSIISIEGYASIEGTVEGNLNLSVNRATAVADILSCNNVAGRGATETFGGKRGANRVVVITYVVTAETNKTTNGVTGSVVVPTTPVNHVEGFDCGNVVDPSIYFEDTLGVVAVEDTATIAIPQVIEVTAIEAVLPVDSAVHALPTVSTVDTFYLPTAQAVRFYMKRGHSRSEAMKIIEARKPQWKPLKKGDIKRPKKARKRLPKARKGNNSGTSWLDRVFPYRNC